MPAPRKKRESEGRKKGGRKKKLLVPNRYRRKGANPIDTLL
jgi:hypothetical protein